MVGRKVRMNQTMEWIRFQLGRRKDPDMRLDATRITRDEARRLYRTGNAAGIGFPMLQREIEDACQAACEDGAVVIQRRVTSDDVALLACPDGIVLGVGADAGGLGAWAVDLGEAAEIQEVVRTRGEAAPEEDHFIPRASRR